MLKAFLSHSSEDAALARSIQSYCLGLQISLYLYEDDAQPGRAISDKLASRIRESDALFALLTPSAAASASVQAEIGAAIANGKWIVPFVQRGVPVEQLVFLQGREWILFDPDDKQSGLEQLAAYFRRLSMQQAAAAAAAEAARARTEGARDALVAVGALILVTAALYYASGQ